METQKPRQQNKTRGILNLKKLLHHYNFKRFLFCRLDTTKFVHKFDSHPFNEEKKRTEFYYKQYCSEMPLSLVVMRFILIN